MQVKDHAASHILRRMLRVNCFACCTAGVLAQLGCWGLAGDDRPQSGSPPVVPPVDPGADDLAPEPAWRGLDRAGLEAAVRAEVPALTPVARLVLGAAQGYCGSTALLAYTATPVADLASAIEAGDIVPGDAAASPLVQRMRRGETADGAPPCTEGEIALVSRFIDELVIEEPAPCEPAPFMSLASMHSALLADVLAAAASDRPWLRYFSVAHSSNAGLCGRELDRERLALAEAVNGLSLGPAIRRPQPVDPDALLYRIDLRDYGWNRPIDLQADGSRVFSDAWLAVVQSVGDLAVEFTGGAAESLKQETGTPVPWLPVHAFIAFGVRDDLYYVLTGSPANLFETRQSLGVDLAESARAGDLYRAGIVGESPQAIVVTAAPRGDISSPHYWTHEYNDEAMTNPVALTFAGGKIIYNLPNGLQAYGVATSEGYRLAEFPLSFDGDVMSNAVACYGCHAAGLLPVADTLREAALADPERYDLETRSAIESQYLSGEDFGRLLETDSSIHVAALAEAGVVASTRDPVAEVDAGFGEPVSVARAAGELGVSLEQLTASFDRLRPLLDSLESRGSVERYVLANRYVASLCALHPAPEVHPANCP